MNLRFLVRWFFVIPIMLRGLGKLVLYLLGASGPTGTWIGGHWVRLPHFVQNVLIGALIAATIHLGHGLSLVRTTEDLAMDWMNRLQVDTRWLNESQGLGYTFLDMDQPSFDAWGEPYHVPRDQLAKLIRYAADGGARAIVVDVDLSRPGTDAAADRALSDLLAGYPSEAPDLILLRTARTGPGAETGPLQWRGTFFNDQRLSDAVYFAHPRYVKDRSDLRLRRWHLIEQGCLNGQPTALPSVQLLLDVLLQAGREGWRDVQARLAATGPHDCAAAEGGHRVGLDPMNYGDRSVRLDAHGVDQRVIYSYSDAPREGTVSPGLERISAAALLKHLPGAAPEPVRGGIVVIGASYDASRDRHETPVGSMPGALVLLNATKSLNQFGQIHGPSTRAVLLTEAGLILLMAWFFTRFDSWWATMLTGSLIILILVPVSFWWFRYGVWIDLAAPILAMAFHQAFANWEESRPHANEGQPTA